MRQQSGGRTARRFVCVCALAWAAVAWLPSLTVASDPARLAFARCTVGWSLPVGVHAAYRASRPSLLDAELSEECMFTEGLVPGAWFTPVPSERAPAAAPNQASGPLWGFVSELRLGVLSHDMAFTGRLVTFPNPAHHRHEHGASLSGEILFVSPEIFRYIGSPRPRVGASLNLAGYTDDVYVDLDWGHAFRAGPYAEAFLGGAWHDGALRHANPRRSELGSRFLFHTGLEVGWRFLGHHGVSLIWEHLSNSSFATPNQGLDRFGIRYGYRFD
jgi:lipid A 3-O-deacylase